MDKRYICVTCITSKGWVEVIGSCVTNRVILKDGSLPQSWNPCFCGVIEGAFGLYSVDVPIQD